MSVPKPSPPRRSPIGSGSLRPTASVGAGLAWMIAATLLFVGQDATSRVLLAHYPALEVTWARYFVHATTAFVIVALRRPGNLIARRPVLQMLRSAALLITTLLAMAALKALPFVDYEAVIWVTPVLVTAFSGVLLKEPVALTGWLGVVCGLVGVQFIVRPGDILVSPAILLPLLAALFNAFYQLTTRMLRFADAPGTTFLYTGLAGVIVCTPALPFVGIMPDASGAALMVLLGTIGATSHFCLIRAFNAAPASIISPFGYASLLWATLFGILVFHETPAFATLLGAALIVAGGLVVLWRRAPVG